MKSASGALQVQSLGPKGIPMMTLIINTTSLGVAFMIIVSHRIQVRLSAIVRTVAALSVVILASFPFVWKLTDGALGTLVVLSLANSAAVTLGIYSVWTLLTSVVPRLEWYHLTVFGAGAQLGVCVSTSLVRRYVHIIPVQWWLPVAASAYVIGFCLIVIGMSKCPSYGCTAILKQEEFVRPKSALVSDLKAIIMLPYMRYILLLMVAQSVLSDAVQWRIYLAAGAAASAGDAAAVLARFYQYTGLLSLGVQLLAVPLAFYILRPRFGILIQPVFALIAVGCMAVTTSPAVVMVIAAAYNSVDYTLNNCMRESLYGPLPLDMKVYSRSLVVMGAPRLGSILSAGLMLAIGGTGGMLWNGTLAIASLLWLVPALKAARIYGQLDVSAVDEREQSLDSLVAPH